MAAALLLAGSGCTQPGIVRGSIERGCVLLLPGVENQPGALSDVVAGLQDGGVEGRLLVRGWGVHPFGTFPNLTRLRANREQAARIAGELVAVHADQPEAPLTIVGFSGGGGMALFVAEALPADFKVEKIILVGAAVSPRYDLAPALVHCRHGFLNYYSPRDWFILGLGTEVFGTMDRVNTESAGLSGFVDSAGALLQGGGVTQVRWRREWRECGHSGTHDGWICQPWAREVLARQIPAGTREPFLATSRPAAPEAAGAG